MLSGGGSPWYAMLRHCDRERSRRQRHPLKRPCARSHGAGLFCMRKFKRTSSCLNRLVREKAPELMKSYGISTKTVAEMLILVGDNPERIKTGAALAKLCGVCPVPASSGKTNRMRLNRGGNRQANAAIYRVAIERLRDDERTNAYAVRRTFGGKTRNEIVECWRRRRRRRPGTGSTARPAPTL